MDDADIVRRLETQERLLHAILAALGPPDQDGSNFDDLVETLSDLTVAVSDVTEAVRALRWEGSARSPRPAGTSSVEG
ncbi:barstar family protein [Methylobacterium sp. Leaf100]|uniref:barstar family protein n=1 Tax=Methylobacterium sp. Leaf100 TaxID=1736252 RepID=UPI0006FAE05D|nr:barstar family protein [Methylobacterium sp. Leaf100]KQP32815.1 hypothetical protein ASF25_17510 [Methylobacterium sp. Leaf100]